MNISAPTHDKTLIFFQKIRRQTLYKKYIYFNFQFFDKNWLFWGGEGLNSFELPSCIGVARGDHWIIGQYTTRHKSRDTRYFAQAKPFSMKLSPERELKNLWSQAPTRPRSVEVNWNYDLTLWVPVGYICPTWRKFLNLLELLRVFEFWRILEKYFQ